MKITKVKTFIVHPGVGKNWLFVKVETDEGIHGWGEAYTQADRDTAIEAHIHKLERYLVGWNPFEIKRFTHMAYQAGRNRLFLRRQRIGTSPLGHRRQDT